MSPKAIRHTCVPYQQVVNQLHEIDIRSEYDIKTQGPKYERESPARYKRFLMANMQNHMHEKFKLLNQNGYLLNEEDIRYV